MMTDMVFAQAALIAGQLEERQMELLRLLCHGTACSLKKRLREGLTEDDCRAEFVAAASLYALAALNEADRQENMAEEFKAGDLTIRRSTSDTPSRCLHHQADLIIAPFLKDSFDFRGV